MYFNIENRDEEYVNKLKKFPERNYGFLVQTIKEHKRGFYGETWKIESDKDVYFCKIIYFKKQAKKYQKCFAILDYMKNNGIDFISQVICTQDKKPYLIFNGGTLALFQFVRGEHAEDNPLTFVPFMVRIYNLPKPPFEIEIEQFSTDCFLYLEKQIEMIKHDKEVFGIIKSNWDLLKDTYEKARHFAEICRNKQPKLFITSGDIGGNSLIYDGKIKIIDWDWIKLSPPERDFCWYVQDLKQIGDINIAFKECGFDYTLDKDILGFYTFNNYIYFLTEYIDCLLFDPNTKLEIIARLREHFDKRGCFQKCLNNVIALG